MIHLSPWWQLPTTSWAHVFAGLRTIGFPVELFDTKIWPEPHEVFVVGGIRHFRQFTYIYERRLGSWDPRNINQRLWMASKGQHSS
ncbi:uncharacterized protein EV420DRAFT_1546956 [Desarmillaria tabescens]|uniref:Uncharacterized protein n=1 Tax=Armillaria tabescens TaxID=1929756 RepID=A0AA39N4L2_ARMTA|nr:uncharacterized protein EV420DRAFT_1546956 [Desarmillaria tabescens]KAK0457712.1 hypothetical protein EV420DRAFT_1546956 [Desarmillaria tabescens]